MCRLVAACIIPLLKSQLWKSLNWDSAACFSGARERRKKGNTHFMGHLGWILKRGVKTSSPTGCQIDRTLVWVIPNLPCSLRLQLLGLTRGRALHLALLLTFSLSLSGPALWGLFQLAFCPPAGQMECWIDVSMSERESGFGNEYITSRYHRHRWLTGLLRGDKDWVDLYWAAR